MTDQEEQRPRRALPPIDGDGAQPDEFDGPAESTGSDSYRPTRGFWAAQDGVDGDQAEESADEPTGADSSTPVPPPAPALPDRDPDIPQSAGRRFATDPAPEGTGAGVPRRSAASVASPPSTTSPTETEPAPADVDEPATEEPGTPRKRSRKPLLVILAALLAVALVAAGYLYWSNQPTTTTTPTPTSASPTPNMLTDDMLATPSDLAKLRSKTTWKALETLPTPGAQSPQPKCLPHETEGLPQAAESQLRTLEATGGRPVALLQLAATYSDVTQAADAFEARVKQLGDCAQAGLLIQDAYQVESLGDEAMALTLAVQGRNPEYHTLVLNRTGRLVNVFDAAQGRSALDAKALAAAVSTVTKRQCDEAGGECPGSVKLTATPPPVADPAGWLVAPDLPRINAAAGRWTATDPSTTLSTNGSQCEGKDLTNVDNATKAQQRTYLLGDDGAAPSGFGIDQITLTFSKTAQAEKFADELTANIKDCKKRTATATVEAPKEVSTQGEDGKKVTGSSFRITHTVDTKRTVYFRVAVLRDGKRVSYLLANPTEKFDFTATAWEALTVRAGERLTQAK